MLGIGVLVALFAFWGASQIASDSTFVVSARTEVVTLDVGCDRRVVWDLPAGRVGALGSAPTSARNVVGVEMRGGARVRLWVGPGEIWRATFERSDAMGCDGMAGATAAEMPTDMIVVAVDGLRLPPSADGYVYEAAARISADGPRPLLPLHGRIVVGDEIVFGAGTGGSVGAPLLSQARIEARTPDRLTLQRRLIHEEQVDAGGIVDSHGCLDTAGVDLTRCLRTVRPAAEGFVYPGEIGDKPGFDVQMLVIGRHVGVRQHGGSERRVVITVWSRWISSAWLQLAAATLVFVATMAQIWSVVQRRGRGPRGGG
ncbi:MAG: hypothetical protein HXY24_05065 [Rubrivivax sp.]|nr:hypothetical protein [Rubrivivax sp.]